MRPISKVLLSTVLSLATVISVSADDLSQKDIPPTCSTICNPIVTLTNTCDITSHDTHQNPRRAIRQIHNKKRDDHDDDDHIDDAADDAAERDCICLNTSFDVPKIAALCAACLVQNTPTTPGQDRDGVEDINEIMSQCSFTSTTYVPEATTAVSGVVVSATKPVAAGGSGSGSGPTGTGTGSPTPNQTPGGSSGQTVKVPGYVVALVGGLAAIFAWN